MKVLSVFAAQGTCANTRVREDRHRRPLVGGRQSLSASGVLPHLALSQRQRGASAGRAHPLVMLNRAVLDAVIKAQRRLDFDEILHMHLGGEGGPAPPTFCGLLLPSDFFLEGHTHLGGALENVEKLAKGKPQEG